MPDETQISEQDFFDALDKAGGTASTDEPVPEATYMFKLTHIGDYKCTTKGDYQISLGITVIDDKDGYDGRMVWDNFMLEGTFTTSGGIERTKAWKLANLLSSIKSFNPNKLDWLKFVPCFDVEKKIFTRIPRDSMDDEADLSAWQTFFDGLVNCIMAGDAKHEEEMKKSGKKDANGKDIFAPSGKFRARIARFIKKEDLG